MSMNHKQIDMKTLYSKKMKISTSAPLDLEPPTLSWIVNINYEPLLPTQLFRLPSSAAK